MALQQGGGSSAVKKKPAAPAPVAAQLVSEHGQGGGYTPGDTGYAPTPAMTGTATTQGTGYPTDPYGGVPQTTTVDVPNPTPGSATMGAPVAQALASNPFQTDPGYLAALAAQQAGSQQLDAALKAAQEQAIVQFGDPALAQLAGFELDPLTAAMAQQNTQAGNSTLAQLGRQRDLNQQGIQNTLAAHGIIRSGDLGYKTGQNQQQYGTELYNAQQGVLGSLAGLARDTASRKAGLGGDVTNALTSAYNTYVQNPQFWGATDTGGSTAALNAQAINSSMVQPPDTASMNQTVAPVTAKLAKPAASRLGAKPVASPYSFRATGRYA